MCSTGIGVESEEGHRVSYIRVLHTVTLPTPYKHRLRLIAVADCGMSCEQKGPLYTGTRGGNPDTQFSMASRVERQESSSWGWKLQQDDPRGASTCE